MTKELITHKIYWDEMYVAPIVAFDTTRKSHAIVHSLDRESSVHAPADYMLWAAEEWIDKTIWHEYVTALKTGEPRAYAETNDLPWCHRIWDMALHSTAGVLSAAESALQEGIAGSLSSGIHHASLRQGMGFCTINAFAVLANYLKGLKIVILDFDAHNGGGTVRSLHELKLAEHVAQWDLSTETFDSYRQDSLHQITYAARDATYLAAVDKLVTRIKGADLVVYNAGVDPYPTISHGALEHRDEIVFRTCDDYGVPCMYVLAGGYTHNQTLGELVLSHIATLRQADWKNR